MFVEAESAVYEKIERREQMQALMSDVRPGDLVLVDKIDRWSRDPEFCYGSVRKILGAGASFYAIGDNCDPSTAEGDTMLGFRILFAREEHKRIKLRMLGTRKLLRDRGLYSEGTVPWGYQRKGGKGLDRNLLVIDEPEAEKVREAFRLSIEGYSLSEIGRKLGVHREKTYNALRSRAVLGEMRNSSGQWIQGRHPAIVDASTFARSMAAVQARRCGERRARDNSQTASWWLRDLAHCAACGAKMVSAYGGVRAKRVYYYRCFRDCGAGYVRVDHVEHAALEPFADRLTELRGELAGASEPAAKPVDPKTAIERQRLVLHAKRERFIHLYADGAIDRPRLQEEMAKLDAERTRLDAIAIVAPPVSPEQRRQALKEVTTVRRAWAGMTPAERRAMAETFAKSVRIAQGAAPAFDWYSAEELARA